MDIFKSAFVAFIATLFCIWLLQPLAIRLGLVDVPNGRKLHGGDIPLIGGIAIFFGFCFALLSMHISLLHYRGMLAGSGILVLMGVVDDFRELSSRLRLCGQLLAGLLMVVWGNVQLSSLGNILFSHAILLGAWALPATVLLVMTNLNAMNMIDGQDGLAGGIALGQASLLTWVSVRLNQPADLQLLVVLIALLLVFLFFNMPILGRKQASIFLGDAGSTLIAFLLAWFAIDLSQVNHTLIPPITVLWIMAFPLFDLVNVSLHRLRKRKPLLSASRDHVHHILQVAGISTRLSTLLLCVFSFGLGLLGIGLHAVGCSESWQFLLFLAVMALYFLVVALSRKSDLGDVAHANR